MCVLYVCVFCEFVSVGLCVSLSVLVLCESDGNASNTADWEYLTD